MRKTKIRVVSLDLQHDLVFTVPLSRSEAAARFRRMIVDYPVDYDPIVNLAGYGCYAKVTRREIVLTYYGYSTEEIIAESNQFLARMGRVVI